MPPITQLIFDCDGVLIDSEVLSMRVWIALLKRHGIYIDKTYFASHFLGRSFEHVKQVIAKDFELIITPQLQDEFSAELKHTFESELAPTEFITSILTRLTVPYVLATSSSRERTHMALKSTGLKQYFSEAQIFTAADVKHGKPAPDLFLYAAKTQGAAPEACLVIEDSMPGIQAARAANMQWLHYTGGSHLDSSTEKLNSTLAHWRDFETRFPQLVSI